EDGIRDPLVTGVQTCALPILSMLFESLREGAELRSERLPGEILHAILKWIGSRENDRVRRPGERNLRDGVFKEDAVVGEGIGRQIGRASCRERVEAEGVGGGV